MSSQKPPAIKVGYKISDTVAGKKILVTGRKFAHFIKEHSRVLGQSTTQGAVTVSCDAEVTSKFIKPNEHYFQQFDRGIDKICAYRITFEAEYATKPEVFRRRGVHRGSKSILSNGFAIIESTYRQII